MPKEDQVFLAEAEKEYIHVLEIESLPLCEEWNGHFEVLGRYAELPQPPTSEPITPQQYFLADYQDSTPLAPPHQPNPPKLWRYESP